MGMISAGGSYHMAVHLSEIHMRPIRRIFGLSLILAIAGGAAAPILAIEDDATVAASDKSTPAIQWFGTWEQGVAEAKRTGRPILLTAAAPQCRGISGMW